MMELLGLAMALFWLTLTLGPRPLKNWRCAFRPHRWYWLGNSATGSGMYQCIDCKECSRGSGGPIRSAEVTENRYQDNA